VQSEFVSDCDESQLCRSVKHESCKFQTYMVHTHIYIGCLIVMPLQLVAGMVLHLAMVISWLAYLLCCWPKDAVVHVVVLD
jgi:hypothetical protein